MGAIDDARLACDSCRWGDAFRMLSGIPVYDLGVDDLDRFGTAAYLTGHDEEGFTYWVRAHQACVGEGAVHRAAYFGVRLAQGLGFKGDFGRCQGWVDPTARLLEDAEAGKLNEPTGETDPEAIEAWLKAEVPGLVTWEGWNKIDRHETTAGEPHGRPRVKVVSVAEMQQIAGG